MAFSAVNNGWAVGDYGYPVSRPLILHWDGSIWSVVSHPNPAAYSILNGVYATSPSSVWAVGYYVVGYTASTLVMHWDGSGWSIVPSPNNPNASANILEGVAVVNASDAWAVGGGGDAPYPLIMHWNGNEWEKSPSTIRGRLYGITSLASNDVWAVGDNNGSDTLIIHWDGEIWSRVYSPNPGILSHTLRAVNGIASNNVWTVGASSWTEDSAQTLTEHYTGQCVTATPTATATPTQPTTTPTSTPLPPTTTQTTTPSATYTFAFTSTPPIPTTTSTACAITFIDVPFGSTFYSYIRCLACRGIIHGYPDNTFHPNNNVTRGQLAKIVSNAVGFTDPPGSQLFEDVLPGSAFYEYIQRLASRGYMSGYPCGNPGEPCGGNNLPYFRPGNNATRGQISKIASNAAGFSEEHNVQMYEDILLDSTFYTFTARLTARNIISGYLCGGVGELCGPANLPYFRPGNNATRGQTSKITANTFYPNCQTPFR